MILGLDISTSCTGWCILNEQGDLDSMGFIDLKNKKDLFSKASVVKEALKKIKDTHEIKKISIEENLQSFRSGFSSAQTLSTLARFNGIVSYLCFDEFEIQPEFLNVNASRKKLGIKVIREKICGITTKEQILNWVTLNLDSYEWPKKTLKSGPRKNQTIIDPRSYDMADAYVIALACTK